MRDKQAVLITAIVAAAAIAVALICNPPYYFSRLPADTVFLQLRGNRWTGHVDVLPDRGRRTAWQSVPR